MYDVAVDALGLRGFFFTMKIEQCFSRADLQGLLGISTRPWQSLCHSLYQVRVHASATDSMPQKASVLQTRACQKKIRNIPGRSAFLVFAEG